MNASTETLHAPVPFAKLRIPQLADWTLEAWAYVLLGCYSASTRLIALGAAPLAGSAARDAMWAWEQTRGLPVPATATPNSALLFSLQMMLFWVGGHATETLARLAPALAGIALVFMPLLLRRELSAIGALAASALLALSPSLTAIARSADGIGLALPLAALTAISIWRWQSAQPAPGLLVAALATGAGLASAPEYIASIVALVVTSLLIAPQTLRQWGSALRSASLWLAVGLALAACSTAFLQYPAGLAAAGDGWGAWLAGWLMPQGTTSYFVPLITAVLYDQLAVGLGISGAVIAARRIPAARFLLALSFVVAAITLVDPQRRANDAGGFVIVISLCGAFTITWFLAADWSRDRPRICALHAGCLFVVCSILYLVLGGIATGSAAAIGQAGWGLLSVIGVVLAILWLITALVGSWWDWQIARRGALAGFVLTALVWTVASGSALITTRAGSAAELLSGESISPHIRLLEDTAKQVSLRACGSSGDAEIVVLGAPSGALAWALRDFVNVRYTNSLSAAITAPIVITPGELMDPLLGSQYLGQRFNFELTRSPLPADLPARIGYLLFRKIPITATQLVLWARADAQLVH
jgi:hypothetical protein